MIDYDPWWNPAVERQATDRAHRIGQHKPVFVYKLIAAGTVEERIVEMQQRKAELCRWTLRRVGRGRSMPPRSTGSSRRSRLIRLGVAERVGGCVAALQSHLVRARRVVELDREFLIEAHAAVVRNARASPSSLSRRRDRTGRPTRVQRIGHVDALAVAAHLDHLRAAIQRPRRTCRMRRASDDAADRTDADELRVETDRSRRIGGTRRCPSRTT